jgi:hypothetical protein
LVLNVSSTARPGDRVRLTAAVLDARGNSGVEVDGELTLQASEAGLDLPASLVFQESDRGTKSLDVQVQEEGVFWIRAVGPQALTAESNPLVVEKAGGRVLWGDLHGHSGLSDGTGTPNDYFYYARDVAALDVVALTDHDHWGMEPLALHPELWQEIRRETQLFHRPGSFVTLLGYEWTSWVHGHRHVLYFSEQGEVLSSLDEAYETPPLLWQALRGQQVLTFAHHSAGGPIATNWQYPPDPELEPVTEIVSVHGSSEAADSPGRIYSPVAGNFVRDVLDGGFRLGFVGSGDGHDGHPGLAHLNGVTGGLAAILSEELTREGVLEALRARRVYATSGPRIVLRVELAGRRMGSNVPPSAAGRGELRVSIAAPGPLDRVEIVRRGEVTADTSCAGQRQCLLQRQYPDLRAGDYLYVRVVQEDGGMAWSSPFFAE